MSVQLVERIYIVGVQLHEPVQSAMIVGINGSQHTKMKGNADVAYTFIGVATLWVPLSCWHRCAILGLLPCRRPSSAAHASC